MHCLAARTTNQQWLGRATGVSCKVHARPLERGAVTAVHHSPFGVNPFFLLFVSNGI